MLFAVSSAVAHVPGVSKSISAVIVVLRAFTGGPPEFSLMQDIRSPVRHFARGVSKELQGRVSVKKRGPRPHVVWTHAGGANKSLATSVTFSSTHRRLAGKVLEFHKYYLWTTSL
ncbi:hypothetical protein N7447_001379 [Penicillium robsamsonii]|uniref:uncharacterized protein n=1 Tax=Penicillium robsamsonii TaxID=1792511 RepID=UPI002548A1CA|nr:uncharacterized protein N7447_001379 [Penicillium robsamsonii]KAJ5835353.1 hypothetical protein N7447_001379 [Penicillium robsamsonii]